MIKVSDYIANMLADAGIRHVFMLTGGGAMHLNDSLGKHPQLSVIFNHHEQASAMAAESYARLTNRLAVVNVTTGPGGINTLNGVFGAWTDSIPMLIISGQVRYDTTVRSSGLPLRQLGDQEYDIVRSAAPMTKYAVMIEDPTSIKYHLQKALYFATHDRPGPVWLDIPMNVQNALIDPDKLPGYELPIEESQQAPSLTPEVIQHLIEKIRHAARPVLLVGTGVRLSGAYNDFLSVIDDLKIPVVTAFNAHDVVTDEHPYYSGRAGTIGDRSGNFAVQNADVLLIFGCRLAVRQVSYNSHYFSRESYKIAIDIDPLELQKKSVPIDYPIHANLADFFQAIKSPLQKHPLPFKKDWLDWCQQRRTKYPVVLPEYWNRDDLVNPYCFVEALGEQLDEGQIIVTANATACITTFQALKIKKNQRLYSNSGSASMGYDLPAAIGACVGSGHQKIICIAGDGSLQQNIQELATIRYHNYPIKLFVLNNQGYHSIRQTQQSYFTPPFVGVSSESGLFFPHLDKLASAYEIPYIKCQTHKELNKCIQRNLTSEGPSICEIMITPDQAFAPKLSSKMKSDGKMVSSPLEDLAPFLSRDELGDNMLIDLISEE